MCCCFLRRKNKLPSKMSRGMDWLTKVKCIQYNIGNESNCLLVNLLLPQYHLWLSILLSQLTNTRVFYLGGKLFILIWFLRMNWLWNTIYQLYLKKNQNHQNKRCVIGITLVYIFNHWLIIDQPKPACYLSRLTSDSLTHWGRPAAFPYYCLPSMHYQNNVYRYNVLCCWGKP